MNTGPIPFLSEERLLDIALCLNPKSAPVYETELANKTNSMMTSVN